MIHLFCECCVSQTLYFNVVAKTKSVNITMPALSPNITCMGCGNDYEDKSIVNTMLLIYKYVVFKYRENSAPPSIQIQFVNCVQEKELLEKNLPRGKTS